MSFASHTVSPPAAPQLLQEVRRFFISWERQIWEQLQIPKLNKSERNGAKRKHSHLTQLWDALLKE